MFQAIRHHLFQLLLLVFILSFTAFIPAYADDTDDSSDDSGHSSKEKIYTIADDVEMKPEVKITYDKPRIVVKAVYPSIFSDTEDEHIDTFNQQINAIIVDEIANFRARVLDNVNAQSALPRSSVKNDLVIDFNASAINTNDNPVVSIRFTIQGAIAGVSPPYHTHHVFNYDLYNGQTIQLADLFLPESDYLTLISKYSNQALARRLKDKELVNTGTAPTENNFKNWNINPYGLLITFDEGQVAPIVYGTQTVLIPYSILKPMLAPDSAVMGCARHRRSCIQNNLLTGGFIDEAAAVPVSFAASNSARINAGHRILNPSPSKS